MGLFAKYTDIPLFHAVPSIMMEREVVVTEKIHGCNARIGHVSGRFRIGGRNEEFDFAQSPDRSGFGLLGWVRETGLADKITALAKSLNAEIIFYGEWFGPGVQKKCPTYCLEKQLRIFDIRINEDFIDWDRVVELAESVGLTTVPVLYRGRPNQALFDQLRDLPSTVAAGNNVGSAEEIGEGIVIKPSKMRRNPRGNWIIAKYKSANFCERKSLSEGRVKPVMPGSATEFIEEFFTLERLDHVLTDLVAAGTDVSAPSALGPVIRGMYHDVIKESKPEYEQLDEDARKSVDSNHAKKTKALLIEWLSEQPVAA